MNELSVLVSTGNLADNIIEKTSFSQGCLRHIDYFAADAGTVDAGPTFLGADVAHNLVEWEEHDLARTIRSKNADIYAIAFEIIFDDLEVYQMVKSSGALSREAIAQAFQINTQDITGFLYYDPGLAVKANMRRKAPSGGPGERDIFGCQQYSPLFEIEIPCIDQ